jgi:hypothetical protein
VLQTRTRNIEVTVSKGPGSYCALHTLQLIHGKEDQLTHSVLCHRAADIEKWRQNVGSFVSKMRGSQFH